jgi:hypothetical protein
VAGDDRLRHWEEPGWAVVGRSPSPDRSVVLPLVVLHASTAVTTCCSPGENGPRLRAWQGYCIEIMALHLIARYAIIGALYIRGQQL